MCECVRAWGREGKRGEGRGVSAVYITAHLLEDVYVLEETLEKKKRKKKKEKKKGRDSGWGDAAHQTEEAACDWSRPTFAASAARARS